MNKFFKKGFTLIELLVVISIIGILITVGSVSYQKAVKLSRDSKRKTDLEQVRQALETYRSEVGHYPTTAAGTAALIPNYIQSYPVDPKAYSYPYSPASGTSPTTYAVCAYLEAPPTGYIKPVACSMTCISPSTVCNYGVTNP